MTSGMHENEIPVPDELVRRLVDAQFPQYADRPLRRLPPLGTDHQLFRLGEDLLVRMPRIDWAVDQVKRDHRWLPVLAPALPLALPEPVAMGAPGEEYPWPWLVVRWLPGENPTDDNLDLGRAAEDLAAFVAALQGVDPTGGPPKLGSSRGAPLLESDTDTVLEQIAGLGDAIDGDRARSVWFQALEAGTWPGPGVWIHGDLQAGNLLAQDRRLSAVIDFGGLGIGDPAPDYAPAWSLFAGESRRTFRVAVGVDDATWARARAWVMLPALTGLDYYRDSWPAFADACRYRLDQVLGDV